ncbi:MAG: GNAT family N-acetyltransferase [Actinomycetota bacterium]|nr:GNAT family N-acetyltransferase [Actinomycetota bacterium]
MTTDRTGTPTHVTEHDGRFTISVDGREVGVADFVDRDGRRVFPHTAVDRQFQGRGLATILVRHALESTRPTGLRVVPRCWMVAEFIEKNPEFADLVDGSSG